MANRDPSVFEKPNEIILDRKGNRHFSFGIGVIQGMKHLSATFTPGKRLGPGLDETLEKLQRIVDEQQSARPITEHKDAVVID